MFGAYTAWLDMARGRSRAFLCSHHRDRVCRWHQDTLTQESSNPEWSPQPGYHTRSGCRACLSLEDGHAKPSL